MSDFLRSRTTQVAALCLGFPAAVSTMRLIAPSYDYYAVRGFSLFSIFSGQMAIIFLPVLIACMVILPLSVLKSDPSERSRFWRKIDFSLWIIACFCVVLFCAYLVSQSGYTWLLLFSAVAYIAIMGTIAETAARIRDKQVAPTLYWIRFFELFPFKQPVGLIMALMLAALLFFIIILFPAFASSGDTGVAFLLLFASTLSLGALTYFCTFILSLSTRYEEANIEKIRAEQFKVELITNVSHDIRTPLTSIINYVDLLKGLPIKRKDFREYVGILDSKAARLNVLIGDLMDATKASTGNTIVDMQEVDLVEIFGQIAGEFDDRFTEQNLALVVRQPEPPVSISADSRHLWRVLENLLGNVVKYSLPGTRVFVDINLNDEGDVLLSMKNTSLTPLDLPSDTLTEQFIRGDRARHTVGSGLGLYIAKSLVELMGGRFAIRATGDLFEVDIVFIKDAVAEMPFVEILQEFAEVHPEEGSEPSWKNRLPLRKALLIGGVVLLALIGVSGIVSVVQIVYRSGNAGYYHEVILPEVYDNGGHGVPTNEHPYPEDPYLERTNRLIDLYTPYIGNASEVSTLVEELRMSDFGSYWIELDTADESNILVIGFKEIYTDLSTFSSSMEMRASLLLVLIGNLDEVRWSVDAGSMEVSGNVTLDDLSETHKDLAGKSGGRNIKVFGQSNFLLYEFLSKIGYFQYQ
jgi:signal transduction histidine kinase